MGQLPIYVINLARRPDRYEKVAARLAELGLAATRIDAVDAGAVDDGVLDRFSRQQGPMGPVLKGDRGCTASHFTAWEAFSRTQAPAAVILEDDVELSDDFADLVRNADWVPPGATVVKFDKFSAGPSRKLLGPALPSPVAGRTLHRLYSRHVGGAAYLVTRKGVDLLLPLKGQIDIAVDQLLFNVNVSRFARGEGVYQMIPTAARQQAEETAAGSDILQYRKRLKKSLPLRLRRLYYEFNLVPRQILWMLMPGVSWKSVDFRTRVRAGGGS